MQAGRIWGTISNVPSKDSPFPHLSPVWYRYSDILVERGEGAVLFDQNGRRYLDFTSGIGVTNTGHCHPRVVQAIQEQAASLIHGQANIVMHRPMLELVSELRAIVPASIDSFFFSNSGAEAVEGAVKLARQATGRPNLIVFQGGFHGRTVGTMSLTTSRTIYRAHYQPLMAGVFVAPFPYAYRYGWDAEETSRWCLDELAYILQTQTAPEETAAFLVEPVLGEGGYVVPPKSFLRGLRELADRHGILLICDEVQTGFGRTGHWFACDHFEVRPDIIAAAKGLASGMPLSAVMASMELMSRWPPGSHGGTYGGNAVCAAAAVATIRTIRDEELLANGRRGGAQLMAGLGQLQEEFEAIGDVRGLGAMIGMEFSVRRRPATQLAKAVVAEAMQRGLLLLTCGPWDNTIRLIPPLVMTEAQASEALQILADSLHSVAR